MKLFVKFVLLIVYLTGSASVWSYSTSIDLGQWAIPPGTSRLKLDDTKMYPWVTYSFRCQLGVSEEKTALIIDTYKLNDIVIEVDGVYYHNGELIKLSRAEAIPLTLTNMMNKEVGEYISFRNLDQTESLTIRCIADVI